MITWVTAKGATRAYADVEINLVKNRTDGSRHSIATRITKGAVASKFGHAPRVYVGLDDHTSRLYFMPTEMMDKRGYRIVEQQGEKCLVMLSLNKWYATFPDVEPSKLVGTYELKKDEQQRLYYVSIGALPR